MMFSANVDDVQRIETVSCRRRNGIETLMAERLSVTLDRERRVKGTCVYTGFIALIVNLNGDVMSDENGRADRLLRVPVVFTFGFYIFVKFNTSEN